MLKADNALHVIFSKYLSELEDEFEEEIDDDFKSFLQAFFYQGAMHAVLLSRMGLTGWDPEDPEKALVVSQDQLLKQIDEVLSSDEDDEENEGEGLETPEQISRKRQLH